MFTCKLFHWFAAVELEPQATNKPTISDGQRTKEDTSVLLRDVHGHDAECSSLAQPLHDSLTTDIIPDPKETWEKFTTPCISNNKGKIYSVLEIK